MTNTRHFSIDRLSYWHIHVVYERMECIYNSFVLVLACGGALFRSGRCLRWLVAGALGRGRDATCRGSGLDHSLLLGDAVLAEEGIDLGNLLGSLLEGLGSRRRPLERLLHAATKQRSADMKSKYS